MLRNTLGRYIPLLLAVVLAAGCATSGDRTYQAEIVKKEPVTGEQIGYTYALEKLPGAPYRYLLSKTPQCSLDIQEYAVERDRAQDVTGAVATVSAPLALAFPRIGMTVLMTGFSKSRSDKVVPAGTIHTGQVTTCGEPEPAPGEVMILQGDTLKETRHLTTNANGVIDLTAIIGSSGKHAYFNMFIDNGESAFFVDTIMIQ